MMITKKGAQLEKLAKEDMKDRAIALGKELKNGSDSSYERWLAKEQREARIIEDNL